MTVDCSHTGDALHAYLDDELDPVQAHAIESHLADCAACRERYGEQRELRSVLRTHADYYAAPPALIRRIRARTVDPASAEAKTPVRRWEWMRLGGAVAVTAVVAWMAGLQFGQPSPADRVSGEVIAGHARALVNSRLTDVASSDQHTVKPWLSAKLDFSPPVPDLAADGFPLVGGRLEYLDSRPVAVLIYRRRQHLIDLFVWPDPAAREAAPAPLRARQGYQLLHWNTDGMTYWAVSDLNAGELRAFVNLYAAGNR